MSTVRRFGEFDVEEKKIIINCLTALAAGSPLDDKDLLLITSLHRATHRAEIIDLLAVLDDDYEITKDKYLLIAAAVAVVAYYPAFSADAVQQITGVKHLYLQWFFCALKVTLRQWADDLEAASTRPNPPLVSE